MQSHSFTQPALKTRLIGLGFVAWLAFAGLAQAGECPAGKSAANALADAPSAPVGVVPLHSHEDRPALIMVNSGEIFEHSSKCAVPILHKAGDVAREFMGTRHWWKNSGTQPVDLTIGDIVNDKKPATMKEKMM
jgi:hypothetical protein